MAIESDDPTSVAARPAPADSSPPGQAYLVVVRGSNVGEMYQITGAEMVIGRGAGSDIRLNDDGVSRFHCKLSIDRTEIAVEDLTSRNGTFCNGKRLSDELRVLEEGDKLQIGTTTVLRFTLRGQDRTFQRHMFDAALRDSLTRAYNKQYLIDRLQSEVRFALRHRSPLALILIDVDHFDQIKQGHLVGDKILAGFASLMHECIRQEDVFARLGGGEFVLLSRAISPADTLQLADRLRRSTESLWIATDDGPITITISVGVATVDEVRVEAARDLLIAADTALHRARADGRNRVVVCRPELMANPQTRLANEC